MILAVLLHGCADLARHAETVKPTAKLTDTRLKNINFEQADLVFDLAVDNRNPVAIKLAGLHYDVKIENQSLLSGVTAQGVEIKPASTSTVQLPVSLKFDDLRKLPGELWQQDNFSYQLDSRFVVDLPIIGEYAIPVSKQGELPVPKMPKISIKDMQVRNIGLSSAELVAIVEVQNPNAFDLGFSDFSYNLNVNKQSWGQGSIKQGKTIPQKGKATIELPLKLDMMSMGTTVYQMLAGKLPLEYRLQGDMTLDSGIELLRNINVPLDIKGEASLHKG